MLLLLDARLHGIRPCVRLLGLAIRRSSSSIEFVAQCGLAVDVNIRLACKRGWQPKRSATSNGVRCADVQRTDLRSAGVPLVAQILDDIHIQSGPFLDVLEVVAVRLEHSLFSELGNDKFAGGPFSSTVVELQMNNQKMIE